jgi:hypothetical protein
MRTHLVLTVAALLVSVAGCAPLHYSRDIESPADAARCDGGTAGRMETGFQVAGRKTERGLRLIGHVFFEGGLMLGNSISALFTGGPKKAEAAWNHGAANVVSVTRHRADQIDAAGRDLCPTEPQPRTIAAR